MGGEKLQAAVESLVQAGRSAGDARSRSQQQADALVQLRDNQLASGQLPVLRGHRPQVIVKIGIEDLADPAVGAGAGEMGFGATISAARARWIACDSQVTRIVMGPDGLPLDVGRSLRLVPPHIRRAAEVRDGGCVFAGCGAPTHWCDVHHLLEWINGGETSLENSALLCERHSHLVSTTASGSNDNPTADGAPGDPTAQKSTPDHSAPAHPSPQPPDSTDLAPPPSRQPTDVLPRAPVGCSRAPTRGCPPWSVTRPTPRCPAAARSAGSTPPGTAPRR